MGRIPVQVLSSVYREAQNFQSEEATILLITLYNPEKSEEVSSMRWTGTARKKRPGKLSELPIVSNRDFGHTDLQFILPLGVKAEIDGLAQRFKLLEPSVKYGLEENFLEVRNHLDCPESSIILFGAFEPSGDSEFSHGKGCGLEVV